MNNDLRIYTASIIAISNSSPINPHSLFIFENIQYYSDDQIRQLGSGILFTSAVLTEKYRVARQALSGTSGDLVGDVLNEVPKFVENVRKQMNDSNNC